MKRFKASEARRRWFEILDRVAAGESIIVERKGWGIALRRIDETEETPDYTGIIEAKGDIAEADRWSWEWDQEDLRSVERE